MLGARVIWPSLGILIASLGVFVGLDPSPATIGIAATALALGLAATVRSGLAIERLKARTERLERRVRRLQERREASARVAADREAEVARVVAQARHLEESKEAFLADVSRELKTPLGSILAATQLLADQRQPGAEALTIIEREAHRLHELVATMNDLAKMDAEALHLDRESADLRELVDGPLDALSHLARERNVTVAVHRCERPVMIRCDRSRLFHAIEHVLRNAVQFSPELARVEVSILTDDDHGIVRVSDQGPSIPTQQIASLASSALDDLLAISHHGGTLALAIAANIAKAHDGELTIEGETEIGSELVLRLPLEPITAAD